jgi:hypothetical protein
MAPLLKIAPPKPLIALLFVITQPLIERMLALLIAAPLLVV